MIFFDCVTKATDSFDHLPYICRKKKSMEYTIIDVRTQEEFIGGNVTGSINIPLNEVVDREDEIREMKQPILFCCLSGGRSGQATQYFKSKGIECENGGGWEEVNSRMNG